MKICHLTTVHPAYDIRIFRKQCTSLARAGHDVTLIVANGPTETVDGVKIKGVKVPYNGRIERMRKTPKAIYKLALAERADVYHFHDPEFIPYALKLLKKGKQVIYDVHEDVPRQILDKHWIPAPIRKFISGVYEWYEDRAARRMTRVITATPHIRDRFLKITPRTEVINNFPILAELFLPDSQVEKEDLVCYIGGISAIRGIRELVKALGIAMPVRLALAGKYSPEALHGELQTYKGFKQVDELGFISRQEAAELMTRSIAGIVTFLPAANHIEAQPNKMFEYMSAGLPVIASHFPLWKKIIEGNACGLCVDPGSPGAIAEAITYLKENPEAAREMGRKGREAVEKTYNWEREEKRLLEIYQQLAP